MLYAILIAIIIVLFLVKRYRERFVTSYIWSDKQKEVSFEPGPDSTGVGNRLFGTTPHTCRKGEELQDGLCYEKCQDGYHGVGPVCWADTVSIGVGKPVGLEPCPRGWVNDGLTCRKPITCEPIKCASGWEFFTKGCTGGGCSGGQIIGRLDRGGVCDWPENRAELPDWLVDKSNPRNYLATHPDKVAGLCYKKCPENMPRRVTGMPYLCMKADKLSYGRGAGGIPPIIKFGN